MTPPGPKQSSFANGLRPGCRPSRPKAQWPSGTIESLKWLAFAAMAADHWAVLVLDAPDHPLRIIGRLALPIFLVLLAQNLAAGASVARYLQRLLPFAILSEVVWRVGGEPAALNILFTLALAALFCGSLEKALEAPGLETKLVAVLPAFAAVVLSMHTAYGPAALYFTAAATWFLRLDHPWPRDHDAARNRMYRAFWLSALGGLAALALTLNPSSAAGLVGILPLALVTAPVLPALPLRRAPWWVYYGLYPAHVALFALIGQAV